MPRVFLVTLTKTFDLNILAESETELLKALERHQYEINHQWDPPDEWTFESQDLLKTKLPLPNKVPKFDSALVGKEFFSADETGKYKERIAGLQKRAQEELDRMHLDKVQIPLPFGK